MPPVSVYVSGSLGGNLVDSASDGAFLARVDGATGGVAWSTTFASALASAPLLLSGGAVDFFAFDTSGGGLIDRVDARTGAVMSSSPAANAGGFATPAVGADGALYSLTDDGVARLAADGTTAWTSGSLLPGGGAISVIALGGGDLVLLTVEPSGGTAALLALDPANGATRWTQTWAAGNLESPIVRPDGSVAVLAGNPSSSASSILVFEPNGAQRAVIGVGQVGMTLTAISAVAEDGSQATTQPGTTSSST
jgi:outer membrane protein assembly factor BamB